MGARGKPVRGPLGWRGRGPLSGSQQPLSHDHDVGWPRKLTGVGHFDCGVIHPGPVLLVRAAGRRFTGGLRNRRSALRG
jgi:hypothetical protein